jgi:hypothetical protein
VLARSRCREPRLDQPCQRRDDVVRLLDSTAWVATGSIHEPFRVELSQAALDAERRQVMSFSISTLLIRNLHDVFGENAPRVGARPSTR